MDPKLEEIAREPDPRNALEIAWGIDAGEQWRLICSHPMLRSRGMFFLRIAYELLMPAEIYEDVFANEYDAARWFILDKMDQIKNATNAGIKKKRANRAYCWDRSFYPEYRESDRRRRMIWFAEKHVGLGPGDVAQVMLFSLGGFLSKIQATESAKCSIGTTCGLFARAVLVAAGDRRNRNWPGETSIFSYIGAIKPGTKGPFRPEYVLYSATQSAVPKAGDIFVVGGGTSFSGNKASDHTGVIVTEPSVDGDTWTFASIDGGQVDGKRTLRINQRLLVGKNKMLFEADGKPDSRNRRLAGWLNIDCIENWHK